MSVPSLPLRLAKTLPLTLNVSLPDPPSTLLSILTVVVVLLKLKVSPPESPRTVPPTLALRLNMSPPPPPPSEPPQVVLTKNVSLPVSPIVVEPSEKLLSISLIFCNEVVPPAALKATDVKPVIVNVSAPVLPTRVLNPPPPKIPPPITPSSSKTNTSSALPART